MKIARTDSATGGRGKTPKGFYRVRCLDATFKEKNGSGNPMTDLRCEIVSPEEHPDADGRTYATAGNKFDLYIVHLPESNSKNFEFMDKIGVQIPEGEEFDSAKVKDYFRGCEWDMALSSSETIKRYDPIPGSGKKFGEPILDGQGNEITNGWAITAWASDVPVNCNPEKVDLGN